MRDRLTFLYVEHCVIHRDQNAITVRDSRGVIHVPAASIATILLGPGTTVSHAAVCLLSECGVGALWVGERSVRFYASGRSLAESTVLLVEQARKSSIRSERLAVARKMYEMRFDEDVSGMTMQQLRGREGARMRQIYRSESLRTGVTWKGRSYDPEEFEMGDPINQALSAANAALYGMVFSAIIALGCSPGLGFVHTGHERSFVYDIADLYKAELTIPLSFEIASEHSEQIGPITRRAVRDRLFEAKILERSVKDIQVLLGKEKTSEEELEVNLVSLWDYQEGALEAGKNYEMSS
ncbi:type I-E CRISPR-associated endonuclease Cas1e [Actinomycetaceae bacterium L2_0104]